MTLHRDGEMVRHNIFFCKLKKKPKNLFCAITKRRKKGWSVANTKCRLADWNDVSYCGSMLGISQFPITNTCIRSLSHSLHLCVFNDNQITSENFLGNKPFSSNALYFLDKKLVLCVCESPFIFLHFWQTTTPT